MFKKLALSCLLISNLSFAQNILSPEQEKMILNEIDTVCGDSWCEGAFDYAFNSFTCLQDKKLCVLNFKMILDKVDFTQSCVVKNKANYEDLLPNNILHEDVYSQLNDCIRDREVKLLGDLK